MSADSVISAMRALEFSDAQILSVVSEMERQRKETAREANARRQREYRERNANNTHNAVTGVTGVTGDIVTDDSLYNERASAPVCSNGSSLRSEPVSLKPNPSGLSKAERKPAARKSALAEDAQPTEQDKFMAAENGLSNEEFREEWRDFRDYHCSRGNLMKNWHLAWATWVRKGRKFKSRAGPMKHDKHSPMNQAAIEIVQELNNEIERETRSYAGDGATVIDMFAASR